MGLDIFKYDILTDKNQQLFSFLDDIGIGNGPIFSSMINNYTNESVKVDILDTKSFFTCL